MFILFIVENTYGVIEEIYTDTLVDVNIIKSNIDIEWKIIEIRSGIINLPVNVLSYTMKDINIYM